MKLVQFIDSAYLRIMLKPNIRDRQILLIALPSIVSNITVPLLGLIDVAITGHLGGARSYTIYRSTVKRLFLWDGIYIGATATRGMLISMAGGMITFFLTYSLLSGPLGNHGLWLAFNAYMLMRGIAQTIMQRNVYKQHTA